ncbi:MAG TPA: asparagine synthase C-terminal domain-containing protein [Terriglobales bacterium]|nr:asparagine synthase C-terminal domain-containing protein [Terriglobales bacterium]
MFRYVAVFWNRGSTEQTQESIALAQYFQGQNAGWKTAFRSEDAHILVIGDDPRGRDVHLLSGDAGVVLGTVFESGERNEDFNQVIAFSAEASQLITQSSGKAFVKSWWGRYVAFVRDDSHRWRVLRAPTGELDCLRFSYGRLRVFCSHFPDVVPLLSANTTINFDYIAAYLCAYVAEARCTALANVNRVVRGTCLRLTDADPEEEWYWDPFEFAQRASLEDSTAAAEMVRQVTLRCTRAWASTQDSIIMALSGGLDSAIVLAGLAGSSPSHVRCVNFRYPTDRSTDERAYAGIIARQFDKDLNEIECGVELSLAQLCPTDYSTPSGNIVSTAANLIMNRLAQDCAASACFSGVGGDQIFFQNGARFAFADYLIKNGFNRRAFMHALDAARLEGETVWRVMLRNPFRIPRSDLLPTSAANPLVAADVIERARDQRLFLHPWLLRDHADVLPGKWWHTMLMCTALQGDMYAPDDGTSTPVAHVAPLLSQPLVELCLQIPSYVLTYGGEDRALARRAFSGDIPAEVIARTAKGLMSQYATALLLRHFVEIEDLLLSGVLVQSGMIHRQRLASLLASRLASGNTHALELWNLACVELWLDRWGRHARGTRSLHKLPSPLYGHSTDRP